MTYIIEYTPTDFQRMVQHPEQMSHKELKRLVDSIRSAGEDPQTYLPDLRIKEAFPFAIFLFRNFSVRNGDSFQFGCACSWYWNGSFISCWVLSDSHDGEKFCTQRHVESNLLCMGAQYCLLRLDHLFFPAVEKGNIMNLPLQE